jgi:1,4-dihydroxy-2-naphthoate octaprenyltransferase
LIWMGKKKSWILYVSLTFLHLYICVLVQLHQQWNNWGWVLFLSAKHEEDWKYTCIGQVRKKGLSVFTTRP